MHDAVMLVAEGQYAIAAEVTVGFGLNYSPFSPLKMQKAGKSATFCHLHPPKKPCDN